MQEQNLPTPVGPENVPLPVETTNPAGASEKMPTRTPEAQVIGPESGQAKGDSVNQSAPALPAVDLPQPITQVDDTKSKATTNAPTVADEVDVIEKVWVDKAKTIVKDTKDDPYEQERQVSGLQTEYQKKRYGNDPVEQM